MIGFLFLGAALLWAGAVWWLSKRIPLWLGMKQYAILLSVLLFAMLLFLPILDEIVGKQQFAALCETSSFSVSPNAATVKLAIRANSTERKLRGYWLPIEARSYEYLDKETGRVFFSYTTFHSKGGWLLGWSYIFGAEKHCDGSKINQLYKSLNIDKLLKDGEKL